MQERHKAVHIEYIDLFLFLESKMDFEKPLCNDKESTRHHLRRFSNGHFLCSLKIPMVIKNEPARREGGKKGLLKTIGV